MVEFEKFPRNSPAFLIVYKSYPGWPSRWSRKNKNLPQAPRFNFMDYVKYSARARKKDKKRKKVRDIDKRCNRFGGKLGSVQSFFWHFSIDFGLCGLWIIHRYFDAIICGLGKWK